MFETPKPRIFVVDDEPVIATSLAIILTQSGFAAEAFSNPLQALEKAAVLAPNLLISDVMMPKMSGIDLAIQIRSVTANCKVLLFSGQAATVELLQQAHQSGYDFRLLNKPVHPAIF
jgi:CheY-like chemotaxis protein